MPTAFIEHDGVFTTTHISEKTANRILRCTRQKGIPSIAVYRRTCETFGIFHEWTILRCLKTIEEEQLHTSA